MENSELRSLIDQSTKLQQLLFRGIAITLWVSAIVVALLFLFAPFEAGEESARRLIGGFGVVFVLVGFYCWYLSRKLPHQVIDLITSHPQEIKSVSHVQARKSGIVAHGVHFKTIKNKRIGVNVANGQVAERIITLVKQELPHIEIK